MASTGFDAVANLGKERVAERFMLIGETNSPLADHFLNKRPKKPLDEQGYRMPMVTQEPGGHNLYAQGTSDFRAPIAMDSDSMRVYPVWYQLAHQLNGSTLRALKAGKETQLLNYRRDIGILTDVALKHMNYFLHGDGTGALSVCSDAALNANGAKTFTPLLLASSGAGEAETKGGVRLKRNHVYAVMNSATGAIKSTFTVNTPGKTSAAVTVANFSANSASGDPVVDLSFNATTACYKKAPAGLRSLMAATGVVQNVDRATFFEWKTPQVNANDLPITPYLYKTAKTYVRIASNDMGEAMGRLIVMTPGQDAMLCIQQFGYRRYEGNDINTARGVAGKYVDAEGDTIIYDADGAEDRIYIMDGNSYYWGEEKSFGIFDEDTLELRMLAGTNGVGSDSFYLAIGCGGNLIKDVSESTLQKDAFINRLSQTDLPMQQSF